MTSSDRWKGRVGRLRALTSQVLQISFTHAPHHRSELKRTCYTFGMCASLRHYQLEQPLGQGGSGRTWLARDTRSGERCVLKQITLTEADSWKSLELFERECQTLQQLDHPRIPRLLAYWSQRDPLEAVMVQSYIPGQNLQQWLAAGRRFDEAEVRALALQACELLAYLHHFSPPIVHRDLKPANLILNEAGELFLIDFGAVRQSLAGSLSMTVVGTFGYMPLEQLEGQALPASDLYALGATLVFLLTGQSPTDIPKKALKPDFRQLTRLSESFSRILDRLLEPDLERRYGTVAEVMHDLRQPVTRPRLGWRTWAAAGLLLTVALLVYRARPARVTPPRQPPMVATETLKLSETQWQAAPTHPWQRLEPAPHLTALSQAPDGSLWGLANNELYHFQADQISIARNKELFLFLIKYYEGEHPSKVLQAFDPPLVVGCE